MKDSLWKTQKNLKKLWKTWNNSETEKLTMKNLAEETHYEKLTVKNLAEETHYEKLTMKNSLWKTWKKLRNTERLESLKLCEPVCVVKNSLWKTQLWKQYHCEETPHWEETQEFRKAKNSTKLHESRRANSRRLVETVLSKSNGTQGKWWKLVQWWNGK